jgi:hypothetical protein
MPVRSLLAIGWLAVPPANRPTSAALSSLFVLC